MRWSTNITVESKGRKGRSLNCIRRTNDPPRGTVESDQKRRCWTLTIYLYIYIYLLDHRKENHGERTAWKNRIKRSFEFDESGERELRRWKVRRKTRVKGRSRRRVQMEVWREVGLQAQSMERLNFGLSADTAEDFIKAIPGAVATLSEC